MKTDLSVIIVNYNTRDLLRDCLRSVFNNAGEINVEVWVIDNASTDSSCDMVAAEFPAVKLVNKRENLGFAKANNLAITKSTGEFILLLNPDTIVLDNALEKLALFLKENENIGMVGPKVLNPDGSLQLACRRSIPRPWVAFYRLTGLSGVFPKHRRFAQYNLTYLDENETAQVEAVSGSCMMVRKDALDKVGLLDEKFFMYGEDLDWCFRFHKKGWKVYYYPKAQIIHYHGASSRQRKTRSLINFYQAMYLFHRKHFAGELSVVLNICVYGGIILFGIKAIIANYLSGFFRK